MIGVVVPAHNEADGIAACLASLRAAARCPALDREPVRIVVVLDACEDDTGDVAHSFCVTTLSVDARNVGAARAVGAQWCLDAGARWLAFTDADTVVAGDWLAAQLRAGGDAVCGTVGVADWGDYGQHMRRHYEASYTDADGHHHIHGANLGVSAAAYRRAGGFQALATSEDVALVDALTAQGSEIVWSAAPRVWTSARRDFRAPGGFGATLMRVDDEAQRLAAAAC